MYPNMDNNGRWRRLANDHRCQRTLKDKDAIVLEIPEMNMVYLASIKNLTIIRSKTFGADTFEVECGWVYGNTISMQLDWMEIQHMARIMKPARR